jgi:hypothetical protein
MNPPHIRSKAQLAHHRLAQGPWSLDPKWCNASEANPVANNQATTFPIDRSVETAVTCEVDQGTVFKGQNELAISRSVERVHPANLDGFSSV